MISNGRRIWSCGPGNTVAILNRMRLTDKQSTTRAVSREAYCLYTEAELVDTALSDITVS